MHCHQRKHCYCCNRQRILKTGGFREMSGLLGRRRHPLKSQVPCFLFPRLVLSRQTLSIKPIELWECCFDFVLSMFASGPDRACGSCNVLFVKLFAREFVVTPPKMFTVYLLVCLFTKWIFDFEFLQKMIKRLFRFIVYSNLLCSSMATQ